MSLRERGCRSDQLPPTIDVNTLPERNTRVVVSMFDFHLYLGKIPNLIYFRWVETTNQNSCPYKMVVGRQSFPFGAGASC